MYLGKMMQVMRETTIDSLVPAVVAVVAEKVVAAVVAVVAVVAEKMVAAEWATLD
jgi:hypothetical protein